MVNLWVRYLRLKLDLGFWLLGPLLFRHVNRTQLRQKFVGSRHGHATEIWDKVGARGMASEITFGTFPSVLAAKREHISTVTAPISTDVCNSLESVRNTMVDLHFITILSMGDEMSMHESNKTTHQFIVTL